MKLPTDFTKTTAIKLVQECHGWTGRTEEIRDQNQKVQEMSARVKLFKSKPRCKGEQMGKELMDKQEKSKGDEKKNEK